MNESKLSNRNNNKVTILVSYNLSNINIKLIKLRCKNDKCFLIREIKQVYKVTIKNAHNLGHLSPLQKEMSFISDSKIHFIF